MADAYGTITVGFSEDFNGDLNGICEILNKYKWDSYGTEFVVQNNKIWLNEHTVQYPTLCPGGDEIAYLEVDGKEISKRVNELTEEEYDEVIYSCNEAIDIEYFSKESSKYIDSGTVYFTCVSNEKNRETSYELLEINADGTGKRESVYLWVGSSLTRTKHVW